MSPEPQATQYLDELVQGDGSAAERLMPLVYTELQRIAGHYLRRENKGHTLQPTALVHEAFLKIVDQTRVDWKGRAHFLAVCAQAMRRILVDHARTRNRKKRGGGRARVTLDEHLTFSLDREDDVLAVDEALDKLTELNERHARVVELRFFAGLDVAEVAEVLGVSKRTVEADWTLVKAWLRREFSPDDGA
ncbi:MAG: RNA polymerase subunit sigma-70 [Planctomycetota bacterium]|nr:MAG: RNA polymerase subunit sigma-70 [Planctomycetota bacterium]